MSDVTILSEHRMLATVPIVLVDFLEEMGFGRFDILTATGINPQLLHDPENQITCLQYRNLIERAISLTENRAFGLEFGQRLNYTHGGLLSLGTIASPTILDSLHFAARTLEVLNPFIEFSIGYRGDYLFVELIERLPWGSTEAFMVETGFSIAAAGAPLIAPKAPEKIVYKFRYKPEKDALYYHQVLRGNVTFEAERNCLFIPLELCQKKRAAQNPTIVRQAEQELVKKIAHIRNERVAMTLPIKNMILAQQDEFPSIEEVATYFHVSSRTLNRRLKAVGTSYSAIVSDLRQDLSRQLLSDSNESIDNIAFRLGYTDSSNFSKAFRSWTGASPSQFRQKHGQKRNNDKSEEDGLS